jgi:hypothetical protein
MMHSTIVDWCSSIQHVFGFLLVLVLVCCSRMPLPVQYEYIVGERKKERKQASKKEEEEEEEEERREKKQKRTMTDNLDSNRSYQDR